MRNAASTTRTIAAVAMTVLLAAVARADVAPPPAAAESTGVDWSYVLMGAVSAFLGALLFLWIGRKFMGRSSK